MAIWQYTFRIVPKDDLKELRVTTRLPDDDFEAFNFWRIGNYPLKFFEQLTSIFESRESWCSDIKLYGSEDSNCIEIFIDDDAISDVTVRIDYTSDYGFILNQLIEFCISNSLSMLDEKNNVLHLDVTAIMQLICSSSQFKKMGELTSDE